MTIRARDVMKTSVLAVRPTTPLTELEDALTAHRITGAPVIDEGKLVGIVSRSDIVRYFSVQRAMAAVLAEGRGDAPLGGEEGDTVTRRVRDLQTLTVKDVMAGEPLTVRPDAPIEEIAHLLVAHHVHRVVVTDGEAILGVISTLDLAQLIADGKLHD